MVTLIILGIALSVLNFISVESEANKKSAGRRGTQQSDGCYGDPFNCVR